MSIENEVLKDFEEIKKIKEQQAKYQLIEEKTQEWMELSSQYNALLYSAIDDESLLSEAAAIKEQMKLKQLEIDELNKPVTI